eukprot:11197638-Lingulodinium_polyedra.AAC.1
MPGAGPRATPPLGLGWRQREDDTSALGWRPPPGQPSANPAPGHAHRWISCATGSGGRPWRSWPR